jgi:hypothetical protein
MPIGTGLGNSGVPDFLACVNGYFVAIEANDPKFSSRSVSDFLESLGGINITTIHGD